MKRINLSIILVSLVVLMASCLKKNQCICYVTNSGPIGAGQTFTQYTSTKTFTGTRSSAKEKCKKRETELDGGAGGNAVCNLEN